MPDETARLVPLDGSLDSENVFNRDRAASKKPWATEVQGELPAADSVIQEVDGVFTISENVPTAHIVCDAKFKSLVDSIMGKGVKPDK